MWVLSRCWLAGSLGRVVRGKTGGTVGSTSPPPPTTLIPSPNHYRQDGGGGKFCVPLLDSFCLDIRLCSRFLNSKYYVFFVFFNIFGFILIQLFSNIARNPHVSYGFGKLKHCQRHNEPEGWVHLAKVTS